MSKEIEQELARLVFAMREEGDKRYNGIMEMFGQMLESERSRVKEMQIMTNLIAYLGALLMQTDARHAATLLSLVDSLKERFPDETPGEGMTGIDIIENIWRDFADSQGIPL
jgi:hypothetical protein